MQFLDEAYGAIRDTILNDATYLLDSESIIKVDHIPLIENTRLGEYLVEFKYLDRLSEEYDLNYENAMTVIAESNNIDANNVGVVIDDWKIIETPELLDIVPNPVLKPISEDSFAYKYVDTFMQAFAETGDSVYIDAIIDEDFEIYNYLCTLNEAYKYLCVQEAESAVQNQDSQPAQSGSVENQDSQPAVSGSTSTNPDNPTNPDAKTDTSANGNNNSVGKGILDKVGSFLSSFKDSNVNSVKGIVDNIKNYATENKGDLKTSLLSGLGLLAMGNAKSLMDKTNTGIGQQVDKAVKGINGWLTNRGLGQFTGMVTDKAQRFMSHFGGVSKGDTFFSNPSSWVSQKISALRRWAAQNAQDGGIMGGIGSGIEGLTKMVQGDKTYNRNIANM